MAVLDINIKERELINEINQDENLLELVLTYVRDLKKDNLQLPCQYSMEELKERITLGK